MLSGVGAPGVEGHVAVCLGPVGASAGRSPGRDGGRRQLAVPALRASLSPGAGPAALPLPGLGHPSVGRGRLCRARVSWGPQLARATAGSSSAPPVP